MHTILIHSGIKLLKLSWLLLALGNLLSTPAWALPDLKLSFVDGASVIISQGYYDGSAKHSHANKNDHFALDFKIPGDCQANYNTPILASASGRVAEVVNGKLALSHDKRNFAAGYGNYVVIQHYDGTKMRYAHLSETFVKQNDVVYQGQKIGKMGDTGFALGQTCNLGDGLHHEGIHLHLALFDERKTKPALEMLPMSGYNSLSVGLTYISDNFNARLSSSQQAVDKFCSTSPILKNPLVERFRDPITKRLLPTFTPADNRFYFYKSYACTIRWSDFESIASGGGESDGDVPDSNAPGKSSAADIQLAEIYATLGENHDSPHVSSIELGQKLYIQAGIVVRNKDLPHTIYSRFYKSDGSKFDGKQHAINLGQERTKKDLRGVAIFAKACFEYVLSKQAAKT